MIQENNIPSNRQTAICMFCDMVEYCKKPGLADMQDFFPFVVKYVSDEDPSVRQAAVFGVGIVALIAGPALENHLPPIINSLSQVINHPDSRNEDNILATENAISAVGKIILSGFSGAPKLIPVWLNWLPTTDDKEESKIIYGNLCTLIESNNQTLFSNNFQYFPSLFKILATVLDSDLVDEPLNNRILHILKKFKELPQNVLIGCISGLNNDQQQKIKNAFEK